MASYVAMLPPRGSPEQRMEQAVFIRDGFSWPGLIVPPLWLLWHRLWLEAILAFLVMAFLAAVYRFAPNRHDSKWRFATVGSVVATVLWLAVSALFSLYVENSGKFEATYGSLAAVVVLMLWFYLTGLVILLGAEINSELERPRRSRLPVQPRRAP